MGVGRAACRGRHAYPWVRRDTSTLFTENRDVDEKRVPVRCCRDSPARGGRMSNHETSEMKSVVTGSPLNSASHASGTMSTVVHQSVLPPARGSTCQCQRPGERRAGDARRCGAAAHDVNMAALMLQRRVAHQSVLPVPSAGQRVSVGGAFGDHAMYPSEFCFVLGMRGHVPGWWTATRGPGEVSGWVDTS